MKYIVCKDNQEYVNENGELIFSLKKLDRINILVGENNSGKSRFIRRLLTKALINQNCVFTDEEVERDEYNSIMTYFNNIINYLSFLCKTSELKEKFNTLKNDLSKVDNLLEKCIYLFEYYNVHFFSIFDNTNNIDSEFNRIFLYNHFHGKRMSDVKFYYIPILRGIEKFEVYFDKGEEYSKLSSIQMTMNDMNALNSYIGQAKTIYKNKINNIYNINKINIFTAEELYDEIVDILLGEEKKRIRFHEFEDFINNNFYNGEGFSINPSREKNCLMVKIRKEEEREMYLLGDGIKQLIILLYPIFMHKDEEFFFFIEEPEINLHPGFQRKFMEILLSDEFSKHFYFINTHSNHIIDVINEYDEVKLYKFKKVKDKKEIKIVDNDYVSILNDLGIRSSSIFLANCTIWVEGISDRLYLRKYLELFFKKIGKDNFYKENIHYSFVEYGGGNLIHWNFDSKNESDEDIDVSWISKNVFLITDNDDTASSPNGKKHQNKLKLKSVLRDNFFELKAREIENYISLEILEKMLKKDNKLDSLTRIKYNRPQNPYVQRVLTNTKTYIGDFLDETYSGLKHKYKAYTGHSIGKKADFANKVCNEINSWDDLTDEAKELAEKVGEFIIKNN